MEVPSSKEKRGERERKGGETGRVFDPGRYLQGSAEQLSISDQWLSFESVLFKALFGFRVSEQTCTRTASPLLRTDQCLSNVKDCRM